MSNETDEFSCYDPSIVTYRYVGVTWGIIVSLVGTVGNLLTIMAFILDKKLQTRFNLLIVNLTLADILYCTFLQPFSVDSYLYLYWRSGTTFCRVFGMLLFVSNSVSILTLCLIAVSRYLLIANTKLFDRIFTRVGMVFILLGTWVIGFASFAPLWHVYVLVQKVCTCSFHRIKGRPYTTILMAFYFVVGLGCVGVFYFLIHRKVKAAAKALDQYKLKKTNVKSDLVAGNNSTNRGKAQELDSGVDSGASQSSEYISDQVHTSRTVIPSDPSSTQSNQSTSQPIPSQIPAPAVSCQPKSSNLEFKKVTRMCFVVFLFFVLSYIPFLLLNIFDAKSRAPQMLHMIAANLTWLNSCINPVLYAAMNRQFKEAYQKVFFIAIRRA
uniref:G-protein coupled receptor 84 n=1 Tax=Geotrypetes seraphini TaxID=260995 RepID=A0A6P8Q5G5_GEOSA|nr:G-protein coupled receptor 84 [Geotrypetes seraphini]XP_033791499.1 G-protein coupled receptor 84 [Geotrypetes seraphini]XP_033791500.1 G-protein coupled receptor 84 [Geotrypetes seraphini]